MTQPTSSVLSQFDQMVNGLLAYGVPREKAEARCREMLGMPEPSSERDAHVLEKAEQVEVRKLFVGFGFTIYNLSQARASKQTPGLPDLWVVHKRLPIAFWFETKRQVGGELSTAQQDFRDECARAGIRHASGDRYAAVELLLDLELAVRGAGQYGIEPIRLVTAG